MSIREIEASEKSRPVVAGDVFSYSWGYDQTNVQFYVVEKVTPKTVVLHEVCSTVVRSDGCGSDTVVPEPDLPKMRPNCEYERMPDGTHRRISLEPLPPVSFRKRVRWSNYRGYPEPLLDMDHGIGRRVEPWETKRSTSVGWGH